MADPALLSEKIRAALQPRRLGEWPTPLEPAPALAGALGVAALGFKREDRAAAPGGGNKVRGLEFLLAGVPPGTVFVTAGGTGSTHCLCTAVHAAALGHQTVLAQFRQPDTVASRAVAAACARRAALIVRAHGPATLPLAVLRAWRRAGALGARRWIPGGGAHPRAVAEASEVRAYLKALPVERRFGFLVDACQKGDSTVVFAALNASCDAKEFPDRPRIKSGRAESSGGRNFTRWPGAPNLGATTIRWTALHCD